LSADYFTAIYSHLPIFAQNIICSQYGRKAKKLRFGKAFEQKLSFLLESQKWSESNIKAYQDEKLSELIRHSYANVQYYRSLMDKLHLKPSDIKHVEDLLKLPVLTKEDIRNNIQALIAKNANKSDLVFSHTSGTTAKSLQFYVSRLQIPFQWAVWWRHRMRFSVNPGLMHVNFTGKRVVPPQQKVPPYWRWNKPLNQALMNMHHMTPKNIKDIISFLNEHDFIYYSGYPSIIHAFAMCALEKSISLEKKPRFIFTGAENMLDFQLKDIKSVTGATFTDQYGFSEGCGNASQCNQFVYHEDFEFGIVECIDAEPLDSGKSKRGKIVCTGFACPEFPFIRYEVGDIGIWDTSGKCCPCGLQSKVIKSIEGRKDDYVLTPEGRRIMRFDYIFKDTGNVKEAQVIQKKQGEICILIVRRPNYSQKDEQFIISEVHKWISPLLSVNFEYISHIEREKNGKFRAVKSML